MDDPDHKCLRDLVVKAFNEVAVDAMRPRSSLLDEIDDPSCFDTMNAYARPLPTIAIALMLGVDTARCHDFKQWSDGKMQMFNPRRTQEHEAILASRDATLAGYFAEVIQKRRKERRADLISSLIDAEEDGKQRDEAEIIDVCIILLIAGNVMTTDLIGNAVLALLRHPNELSKLLAKSNLVRSTVEEVLRYDSPVVHGPRIATEAMQTDGCRSRRGRRSMPCSTQRTMTQWRIPDPKRL
jgi:cytochrome P450